MVKALAKIFAIMVFIATCSSFALASSEMLSKSRAIDFPSLHSETFLADFPLQHLILDHHNRLWAMGRKNIWVIGLLDQQVIKLRLSTQNGDVARSMTAFENLIFVATSRQLLWLSLDNPSVLNQITTPSDTTQVRNQLHSFGDTVQWYRDQSVVIVNQQAKVVGSSKIPQVQKLPSELVLVSDTFIGLNQDGIFQVPNLDKTYLRFERPKSNSARFGNVIAAWDQNSITVVDFINQSWSDIVIEPAADHRLSGVHLGNNVHCFFFDDGLLEARNPQTGDARYYEVGKVEKNLDEIVCKRSIAAISSPRSLQLFELKDPLP